VSTSQMTAAPGGGGSGADNDDPTKPINDEEI